MKIEWTLSKIMAYLLFLWLIAISIVLIVMDRIEYIVGISGIVIGAISAILSVKNVTSYRNHDYPPARPPRRYDHENEH